MSAPSAVAASLSGLRPYQARLISLVQREFRDGARSVMMQLGTGGGKTHCVARGVIAPSSERGLVTLFLADLEELLDDTAARLNAFGLHTGIIKAGRRPDLSATVQIGSVQTVTRRMGSAQSLDGVFALPRVDRIIIDEARIAGAPLLHAFLRRFPKALLLGLDATPSRGDGQPLDAFERIVCGPSIRWMQDNGYLVRARVFAPDRVLERGVAEDPVQTYLRRCVRHTAQGSVGRRAVIFAPNSHEARRIARELTGAGYQTQTVLSGMPSDFRKRVRQHMRDGAIINLVSCRALLKGFDLPLLDTAIIAQAQHSVADCLQSWGRVLRVDPENPGKTHADIYDLRGASVMHGLPDDERVWDLSGTSGRRSEETVRAGLRRCAECHAMFAPCDRCPVCGAVRIIDMRPLAIQRAEMREASGVPADVRAEQWVAAAIARIQRNKPGITEAWARAKVLAKASSWVREALAQQPTDSRQSPQATRVDASQRNTSGANQRGNQTPEQTDLFTDRESSEGT